MKRRKEKAWSLAFRRICNLVDFGWLGLTVEYFAKPFGFTKYKV